MSDPSIIQVLKVFKDGLSNGRQEIKVPREREPTDGDLSGEPFKVVELSHQHFLIGDIKLEGTPVGKRWKGLWVTNAAYLNINFSLGNRNFSAEEMVPCNY
jgi:hypothetical protein